MTARVDDGTFTLKRVQDMLGLSRTTIDGLIAAGFVAPTRGPRNEHRFSFRDLMLLRTAHSLQQANIPPRKILRSLARLQADLPESLPLTGLRITAVGADVVVRDRAVQWQAESGQLLMDFEVSGDAGRVSIVPLAPGAANRPEPPAQPVDWFQRGAALEPTDPAGAEAAYRQAIALDPARPAPWLNLGAVLCEASRCAEAVALYERAVAVVGQEPTIHYNHAIALEDQHRDAEAIAAYEAALALDAAFADAHYNLGVLLERHNDAQGALRHFNAYRRLERSEGG